MQIEILLLPSDPDVQPGVRSARVVLRAVSDNAYFFVEDGTDMTDEEVQQAADSFEAEVWPAVTGALGLPPIPGVDGDPRVAIIHAGLSADLGGYVSAADIYPKAVSPHSNEREAIYLNTTVRPLGSPGYAYVLAHELQHLIHRAHDRNEETWLNEGLSEYAASLIGASTGFAGAFLDAPDTQLSSWSNLGDSAAHYGASALFVSYLLEQTAGDPRLLAAGPADSIEAVREFLKSVAEERSAEDFVADWAVANLLDNTEGPYGYRELEVGPPATTEVEGPGPGEGNVRQFATDYLELEADLLPPRLTFTFEGDAEVPVIEPQASAPGTFWWANRGDGIDSTLTRELDLSGVAAATLTFRTWFDIERWFDYGYVAASTDGGRRWQTLQGTSTTVEDPLGASYGIGYTGTSGGSSPRWVDERIDLTPYAGSKLLLRFEYITDEGYHAPGWLVDDIAVPEIGFFDDAEQDVSGWHREGFRRLADQLPQRFALRLITFGDAPEVSDVPLDAANRATLDLAGLGTTYQRAIIAILGLTEGTTEPARYRFELTGSATGE